jgi:hypothetical protein
LATRKCENAAVISAYGARARGRSPITVPDHKTVGRGLLKKVLRDAELSVEEFIKLCKSAPI